MRKSTINDAAIYRSGEGMSVHDFKKHGKDLIDYINHFMKTISSRRVNSDVEPFYLVKLLPDEAPHEPEEWDKIMKDVEDKIMPGVTHWNHPYFFAYFASANSYPGILGDMLSSALACQAFNWFVSPACTELEMVVTDWYGKALGLPKSFLHSSGPKKGGGCAQKMTTSAADKKKNTIKSVAAHSLLDGPAVFCGCRLNFSIDINDSFTNGNGWLTVAIVCGGTGVPNVSGLESFVDRDVIQSF